MQMSNNCTARGGGIHYARSGGALQKRSTNNFQSSYLFISKIVERRRYLLDASSLVKAASSSSTSSSSSCTLHCAKRQFLVSHESRPKYGSNTKKELHLLSCSAQAVEDVGIDREKDENAKREEQKLVYITMFELARRCKQCKWDWEAALDGCDIQKYDNITDDEGRLRLDGRQVSTFLKELSKIGCGRNILSLWAWMDNHNEKHVEATSYNAPLINHNNVYSYTRLISCLAPLDETVRMEEIMTIFDEMKDKCPQQPDVYTYSALVSACEKRCLLDNAKDIMTEMRRVGITPNVVTYNSFISCTKRVRKLEDALNAYNEMVENGVDADVYTYR